jgi:hypothetical protein
MNLRPAQALVALALTAATAGLAGCSGSSDSKNSSGGSGSSTPVAQVEDNSPLAPGDYRVALSGALSGNLDKDFAAKCDTDGEYRLTLTGKVNGVATVIELSNLDYKQPGQVVLKDSGVTADVGQSDTRKDWRNQSYDSGDGTVTYNPDGKTGSFDLTLPEISYDTAAVLPNQPPLMIRGRWSCGTEASPSSSS